jgi:DNA primase
LSVAENATVDDIEHADRIVIDLGEGVAWDLITETTVPLRNVLDSPRNGGGTTTVAFRSPRVRSGFSIARPMMWKQVENGISPDAFTLSRPRNLLVIRSPPPLLP